MQYQSKKILKNLKKNSFSLCYIIEKKVNIAKIELLLENVLRKNNSFIFESLRKQKQEEDILYLALSQILF